MTRELNHQLVDKQLITGWKTSSSKLKTNPKMHETRSVGNDTTATDPNSKGYSKVD